MVLPLGSNTEHIRVRARARASVMKNWVNPSSLIDGGFAAVSLIDKETIKSEDIASHGRASSLYWLSLVLRRHARSGINV